MTIGISSEEQSLRDLFGTPDNLVRSIAAQFGIANPKLVVNSVQYEQFRDAGLSEEMMILNRKIQA